jgi:hypothetical protein
VCSITVLSDSSWCSTFELVYPATESLLAVTACPLLVDSPLAVSGGYGVQWQFVPRGTESPRATIDHVRDAPVVVGEGDVVEDAAGEEDAVAVFARVEDVVVEDVPGSPDELPHPLATLQRATRPPTTKPSFRPSTSRV